MHTLDGNAKLCGTCHGARRVYEYIGVTDDEADDLLRRLGMQNEPPPQIVQEITKPCPDCKDKRGVSVGVVVRRGDD